MEEKSVNWFFNAFFPQSSGGGNMYIYKLLLLILMVFRVLLIKKLPNLRNFYNFAFRAREEDENNRIILAWNESVFLKKD